MESFNYKDLNLGKYQQLGGNQLSKTDENETEQNLTDGLSENEMKEIDTDNDGVITEAEFKKAFDKYVDIFAAKEAKKFDTDKDGIISFNEYVNSIDFKNKQLPADRSKIDKNQDGRMTEAEFKDAIKETNDYKSYWESLLSFHQAAIDKKEAETTLDSLTDSYTKLMECKDENERDNINKQITEFQKKLQLTGDELKNSQKYQLQALKASQQLQLANLYESLASAKTDEEKAKIEEEISSISSNFENEENALELQFENVKNTNVTAKISVLEEQMKNTTNSIDKKVLGFKIDALKGENAFSGAASEELAGLYQNLSSCTNAKQRDEITKNIKNILNNTNLTNEQLIEQQELILKSIQLSQSAEIKELKKNKAADIDIEIKEQEQQKEIILKNIELYEDRINTNHNKIADLEAQLNDSSLSYIDRKALEIKISTLKEECSLNKEEGSELIGMLKSMVNESDSSQREKISDKILSYLEEHGIMGDEFSYIVGLQANAITGGSSNELINILEEYKKAPDDEKETYEINKDSAVAKYNSHINSFKVKAFLSKNKILKGKIADLEKELQGTKDYIESFILKNRIERYKDEMFQPISAFENKEDSE